MKTQHQRPKLSDLVEQTEDIEPEEGSETEGRCRICTTETEVGYATDTVFSNAFTDAPMLKGGDCVCWRCRYIAENKDYRRYHWIATEEDGVQTTKDRQELLETLLDPPEGRWMMQVVTDFLNVLNGWIAAQRLNASRDRYSVVLDRERVHMEWEDVVEMTEYARELRERDVAKRVLKGGPDAADFDRYEITRDDMQRIDEYAGRQDWELIIRLIE